MYYENSCARDLQIAYIGGGSRGWAWTFMTDLAMEQAMCGTLRLYDIDRDSAEANKIIGQRIAADPRAGCRWRRAASSSRTCWQAPPPISPTDGKNTSKIRRNTYAGTIHAGQPSF